MYVFALHLLNGLDCLVLSIRLNDVTNMMLTNQSQNAHFVCTDEHRFVVKQGENQTKFTTKSGQKRATNGCCVTGHRVAEQET
jgi:hypothetical protein